MYNFDYISNSFRGVLESASNQSHRFDTPLSYSVYRNAYVAPYVHWNKSVGVVLDEVGNVVKDSSCYEWKESNAYYDFSASVIEPDIVIYLGFLVNVFGHAFTDNLRKVWFLDTEECKKIIRNGGKIVYTTQNNEPLPGFIIEAFLLSGIEIEKAKLVDHLTQFDTVIIPQSSIISSKYGRLYNTEYEQLINKIKRSIPNQEYGDSIKKLYFTRTQLKKSRDIGENSLERAFRRLGYTIVAPEHHSIITQIQMINHCSHFAATEGSISHLSLFCKPGTDVVLINKANYLNYHQVMINEFANLNVTYIESHHSSFANKVFPWWGPFYLYPTRFFIRYLGHGIYVPYWFRYDYWLYFLRYNKISKIIKRIVILFLR